MSLTIGFDTGLRALRAAQLGLQTVGNNISNANTPGYSRQDVLLSTTHPLVLFGHGIGTGVDVSMIRRIVDESLEARLRSQQSVLGRYGVERMGFQQIESLVTGAGGVGLDALLGKLFDSFSALGTHPDDSVQRKVVASSATGLAGALRDLSAQLEKLRVGAEDDAEARVMRANDLTEQIAELNEKIQQFKAKKVEHHSLLDARGALLTELSGIVETTTVEDSTGSVRVMVGGHTVVSSHHSFNLQLAENAAGEPVLRVKGAVGDVAAGNGAVAGLLRLGQEAVPGTLAKIDAFAKALALAVNRVHSTGVPLSGGFQSLVALNAPNAGAAGANTPLALAGLPFDVKTGDLWVNVTDAATGDVVKTKLAIDPNQSLNALAAQLNAVANLDASVDATGHLLIGAHAGYKFDFSPNLDPNPDPAGVFGGGAAAITASGSGPFALTAGDTMTIAVDGGAPQTITFGAGQFASIGAATAAEVAAAINSQLTGATAVVQNGALSIVSGTTGGASSLLVTDGAGAPAAALGLSTALETGSATAADVKISGAYTGASNTTWTFKPDGNGTVGVTPGLTVGVFDPSGARVATLNVGEGYAPGTEIAVADGVKISLGPGALSAAHDEFRLDVVADSDTSDVLAALGVNALFTGNSASTIDVRADLAADPSLFAASITGATADGGNLEKLLGLKSADQESLGGLTLTQFVSTTVSDIGFDTKRAIDLESTQQAVVDNLASSRAEVSGVSLDEEMANLVKYQQAFQAAGRFIDIIQENTAALLELVRP